MTAAVTLVALLLLARRVFDLARGRAEVRPRLSAKTPEGWALASRLPLRLQLAHSLRERN